MLVFKLEKEKKKKKKQTPESLNKTSDQRNAPVDLSVPTRLLSYANAS